MKHVFLSYARKDAEPVARALKDALESADLRVWWDRASMESRGQGFLQEIRSAIESSERVLAVISPAALDSEYVRSEWSHAIRCGAAVVPILHGVPWTAVPGELAPFHGIDLGGDSPPSVDGLRELRRLLRTAVEPLGPFLTAMPPHPLRYEPRDALDTQLRDSVLSSLHETEPSRATLLRGMGGAGKSVAASSFCSRGETRRAFRDGILWVPCGRTPGPAEPLRTMAAALGLGAIVPGVEHLKTELADRCCLVVLDDLWDLGTLTLVLDALGPSCRLLVTTRTVRIAGAQEIEVGALPEDEALALLATWAGVEAAELPPAASDVAAETGYLAFALALCGAMQREGVPWDELCDALREADLSFLAHGFPEYREFDSLLKSLKVSFDVMELHAPELAARCRELVVFAQGEPVPESAISRLWARTGGLTNLEAKTHLRRLEARSLVRLERGEPWGSVRLHDLHHDYLRAEVRDVEALHEQLLDAYRPSSGVWEDCDDRVYILRWLSRHLEGANRRDELHALLSRDECGRNSWCQHCETIGELGAAVHMLREARRPLAEAEDPGAVAANARYALMAASIRSCATQLPTALILSMARAGVLSTERAVEQARQSDSPTARIEVITTLQETASPRTRAELLSCCDAPGDEHDLPRRLAMTVEFFCRHDDLEGFQAVLDRASQLDDARAREAIVSAAAPCASERMLPLLVGAAEAIGGMPPPRTAFDPEPETFVLYALAALAPRLAADQREGIVQRLVAAVRSGELWLYPVLADLSSVEAEALLADVVAVAHDVHLPALAVSARGESRRELVGRAIRSSFERFNTGETETLTEWLGRLEPEERVLAWREIGGIGFEYSRTIVAARLAPLLPSPFRAEAAEWAWGRARRWLSDNGSLEQIEIASALCHAAPFLEPQHREAFSNIATGMPTSDPYYSDAASARCRVLFRLSEACEEPERSKLLDLAVDGLAHVPTQRNDCARVVGEMAPLLDGPRCLRSRQWLDRADDESDVLHAWMQTWPSLGRVQREWIADRAFTLIEAEDEWSQRRGALELYCDSLVEIDADRCVAVARGLPEPGGLRALARIARALPGEPGRTLAAPLQHRVVAISDARARLEAIEPLLTVLGTEDQQVVRAKLVGWLAEVEHPTPRAELLVRLQPQLGDDEREEAMRACVEAGSSYGSKAVQRDTWRALAPHVGTALAHWMLDDLRHERDHELEGTRCRLIARLAELGSMDEANALLEAPDWEGRDVAEILGDLAPRLTASQVAAAIVRAEKELRPYQRELALAGLLWRRGDSLESLSRIEAFELPFHAGHAIGAILDRADPSDDLGLFSRAIRGTESIATPFYRQPVFRSASEGLLRRTPIDEAAARRLLHDVLDVVSGSERVHACRAVAAWAPVIVALGGQTAWEQTTDALRDVVTWWPSRAE